MTLTSTTTQRSTSTATRTGGATSHGNAREIRSTAWFVGVSLALTAAASGAAVAGIAAPMLPFALAIGPALIALAIARREGNGAAQQLLRSIKTRPVQSRWYAALAIPVLGTLAVVPIAVALGQPSTGLFDKVVPAIFIVPLVVLIPAFAEELAWRGFALPRLATSVSPLTAGLLLAIPWAVLHLALFLPGQMYEGIVAWPSVVAVTSLSVIGAWLFVGTGGSVLITGLFHALFNGATPLMSGVDSDVTWQLRALVFGAIAIAVVALGGFRGPAFAAPEN